MINFNIVNAFGALFLMALMINSCDSHRKKDDISSEMQEEFIVSDNKNGCYNFEFQKKRNAVEIVIDKVNHIESSSFLSDCLIVESLISDNKPIVVRILSFNQKTYNQIHKSCTTLDDYLAIMTASPIEMFNDISRGLETGNEKCWRFFSDSFAISKTDALEFHKIDIPFDIISLKLELGVYSENQFVAPLMIESSEKSLRIYCGYFENSQLSLNKKYIDLILTSCIEGLI